MNLIRKKEIKFVKLILISPWLGQIIDLVYLICLPILVIKFINYPVEINNYNTNDNISIILEEQNLNLLRNKDDFFDYLSNITNKIYDFNSFPMFIPIGPIRLKKFSMSNDCYFISPECRNNLSCKILFFNIS